MKVYYTVLALAVLSSCEPVAPADRTDVYRLVEPRGTGFIGISGGRYALVQVKFDGCIGEVSGVVERVSERKMTFRSDPSEWGICTMQIDTSLTGSVVVVQGRGCTSYHGAACSFSGLYQ